jgi:hypothetical protein
MHDYVPDFIVCMKSGSHLILETKGYDERSEIKKDAARRWIAIVNAEGSFDNWSYRLMHNPNEIPSILDAVAREARTNETCF